MINPYVADDEFNRICADLEEDGRALAAGADADDNARQRKRHLAQFYDCAERIQRETGIE